MSVINMQTMRYINLLDKASRVKTSKCFIYNNTIIFAVPAHLMSRAIGSNAENVRLIQDQLGKRIRIIREPTGIGSMNQFIQDIVTPVRFKSLEIKDKEAILTAGNAQNKAALFGRNKKRYEELDEIIQGLFALDLKII